MPIGEFGRPPELPSEVSPALTTPMYWMYEMGQASLNPARAVMDMTKLMFENPFNPWSTTQFGKSIAAFCELFERTTRRYGKPEWRLDDTEVNGVRVPVEIKTVWEKPFCRLLYFERKLTQPPRTPQPRVLIVAPMSGHYATLLRGTVEAFLPGHERHAHARFVCLADQGCLLRSRPAPPTLIRRDDLNGLRMPSHLHSPMLMSKISDRPCPGNQGASSCKRHVTPMSMR